MEFNDETYENLPKHIKAIVDTWDENAELYSECKRIDQELKVHGYTIDYGLSGDITDIDKI